MIKGLGVDIESISRVEEAYNSQKRFAPTILTPKEFEDFENIKSQNLKKGLEFLATRFSAKEAFSKAMGTGIGIDGVDWQNIEINKNELGKPKIYFNGKETGLIAITHKDDYVFTQVIIE